MKQCIDQIKAALEGLLEGFLLSKKDAFRVAPKIFFIEDPFQEV